MNVKYLDRSGMPTSTRWWETSPSPLVAKNTSAEISSLDGFERIPATTTNMTVSVLQVLFEGGEEWSVPLSALFEE
jgi:hypothetical protein